MAILTLKGHISRALDFYSRSDSIFVAIGKYTEWARGDCEELSGGGYNPLVDYNISPPSPAITDDLLELIGLKKLGFISMVVQDEENGTLEYRGTKWRTVSAEKAFEEGARWVYMSTTLTYNELPVTKPYRQVGIYSGVSIVGGSDPFALLPDHAAGKYVLKSNPNITVSKNLDTDVYSYINPSNGRTVIVNESDVKFVLDAILEVLDNRKPVYRDNDVREMVKLILEF